MTETVDQAQAQPPRALAGVIEDAQSSALTWPPAPRSTTLCSPRSADAA